MGEYVEFFGAIPLLVFCYQLYAFAASSNGEVKQRRCQHLGIFYMTAGIMALVVRGPAFVFIGLMLLMFGFRLLAKGLDRMGKITYIDRYDGDN